jgi:hypothetical protein
MASAFAELHDRRDKSAVPAPEDMKILLALGLLAGCEARFSFEASSKSSDVMPAAVTAWMPTDPAKAWEGAWVTRLPPIGEARIGEPVALVVTGSSAAAFDGTNYLLDFEVTAPCSATFLKDLGKGFRQRMTMQFVLRDGALFAGAGAAGYRRGTTAIVCMPDEGTVVVDAKGTCTRYRRTWEGEDCRAAWSRRDGRDVLAIDGERPISLVADGELLRSDQFAEAAALHGKAESFAVAVATVRDR